MLVQQLATADDGDASATITTSTATKIQNAQECRTPRRPTKALTQTQIDRFANVAQYATTCVDLLPVQTHGPMVN